jgi:Bacterial SH3 domain
VTRLIAGVLIIYLNSFLAGCSNNNGGEFIGEWVKGKHTVEIVRNGESFLFIEDGKKNPANLLKDDTLSISVPFGPVIVSYSKATDTIIALGDELKRKRSQTVAISSLDSPKEVSKQIPLSDVGSAESRVVKNTPLAPTLASSKKAIELDSARDESDAVVSKGWLQAFSVDKDKTNIRATPSVDSAIVIQMAPGSVLEVKQSQSVDWYEVRRIGTINVTGFVRNDRVTIIN